MVLGRLSLLVAALACASCAPAFDDIESETREVVRGRSAVGYPSAGMLQRSYDEGLPGLLCTGTLIGCDTFLTAAHCVCEDVDGDPCGELTPATELSVYFQHGGIYQVASVEPHPGFDFPQDDVAVLRLDRPVLGVRPAPLQRSNPAVDSVMTIVGFGNTFKGSGDGGIKREGVLHRTSCDNFSDEVMLCFDGEDSPSVSCNGDSGGPNYLEVDGEEYVAGIVAGGGSSESCAVRQKFATQVSAYLDFIEEHGGVLGEDRCGDIPQVDAPVSAVTLDDGREARASYEVEVPEGTAELRIGANSEQGRELSIAVAHERQPDYIVDDCSGDGRISSYCSLQSPKPGLYQVVVSSDAYHQVAMSTLPGAPKAVTDLYETNEGEPLEVSAEEGLLRNDQSRRGLELFVSEIEYPQHGELLVGDDGSFQYQPHAGYVGTDVFSYQVTEDPYTAKTRVFIDVLPEDYQGDCGCQSSSSRSPGSLVLCFLAVGWTARRRRRSR